jgi:hypothetical protein
VKIAALPPRLKGFICPDQGRILTTDCLKEGGCRMGERCASRSYLKMCSSERHWTGKPSTTQLIQGTMCSFLKLTQEYYISPDSRAFMINGTKGHKVLESCGADDEFSLIEEAFTGEDTKETGIADFLEIENGTSILGDNKVSGSYKVAKALGMTIVEEATDEVFKSGKRKGEKKTRKVLVRDESSIDRREWELQLNKYRIEFQNRGFKIDKIKIQCIVRDGGTYIARSRGVFRNVYYFEIARLDDNLVLEYFERKRKALEQALKQGYWDTPCDAQENWGGLKCSRYCEVADFCSYGRYLKQEKETEDMAIKNLSEVRRLPRLGKIRLGIKKTTSTGKEYPAEVDYFILDPATPSELENKKLIEEFQKRYGEQPKQIPIMLPVGDIDVVFPQFYKRYGKTTSLQCKGDGETAVCASAEYATGLEAIGKDEMGLPKVKCLGPDCPYQQNKQCSRVGTLNILLPELPGAGVWQIVTGSVNSIINLNSCLDYVRAVCGRFQMIPLMLERRPQEIQHTEKNGEVKKRTHYIMQITLDKPLVELQKYAMIDATKILIDLPAPDTDKEDILFLENKEINPEPVEVKVEPEPAKVGPEPAKKTPESVQGILLECKTITAKLNGKDTLRHKFRVGEEWYGTFDAVIADKASGLLNLEVWIIYESRTTKDGKPYFEMLDIKPAVVEDPI